MNRTPKSAEVFLNVVADGFSGVGIIAPLFSISLVDYGYFVSSVPVKVGHDNIAHCFPEPHIALFVVNFCVILVDFHIFHDVSDIEFFSVIDHFERVYIEMEFPCINMVA